MNTNENLLIKHQSLTESGAAYKFRNCLIFLPGARSIYYSYVLRTAIPSPRTHTRTKKRTRLMKY